MAGGHKTPTTLPTALIGRFKLIDPNHPCEGLFDELLDVLQPVLFSGVGDDSIGEINSIFNEANYFGVGDHLDSSLADDAE